MNDSKTSVILHNHSSNRLPTTDLDEIIHHTVADLQSLKRARIFMTGGTGYIGRWLVEALHHANTVLGLELQVTVLSRDPAGFLGNCPHLSSGELHFIRGDVRDFAWPAGAFTHSIHAATDVIAPQSPLDTFDVTVSGTRRVLDFCRDRGVANVLLLSSGAVYGKIPPEISRVPETYHGRPDLSSLKSAYGIGKIATEWLGCAYSSDGRMACKSARVFAQVGPHLALDKHFAIGNFILNAIKGEPFTLTGDGTPRRSYMYATDLVSWLLAILTRGRAGVAYNVGSDQAISIRDLALRVARVAGITAPDLRIASVPKANSAPEWYVPETTRARTELGVKIRVPFDEACTRTVAWYREFYRLCI